MNREEAISRQAVIDFFNSVFSDEFIPFDRARMFIDGIYHAVPSVTPQPCEDAISRQAAINILDDMVKDYVKENDFDKAQGVAWVKVQKLPSVSAEKTGRWIPVSERLPEDRELILFSTKTDRVFEGRYFDDNTGHQWYSFRDDIFAWNNVVTAWMPLPQPYKAESEDDR